MNSRGRFVAGGISLLIYAVIFLLSSLPAASLPSHIPDFIPPLPGILRPGFFHPGLGPARSRADHGPGF